MNANTTNPPAGRGRAQLLLLATLFFAPFVAAYVLYFYFPQAQPTSKTNYGELVTPPRSLPQWNWTAADGSAATPAALAGKWTYLQRIGSDCDAACADRLILTRQMRTALNEKRERVQRAVIVADAGTLARLRERLGAQHPDLLWFAETADAAAQFFGGEAQAVFLVDPLGNYLMLYPPRQTQEDFKGMQKDIKKLLRASQIG